MELGHWELVMTGHLVSVEKTSKGVSMKTIYEGHIYALLKEEFCTKRGPVSGQYIYLQINFIS